MWHLVHDAEKALLEKCPAPSLRSFLEYPTWRKSVLRVAMTVSELGLLLNLVKKT